MAVTGGQGRKVRAGCRRTCHAVGPREHRAGLARRRGSLWDSATALGHARSRVVHVARCRDGVAWSRDAMGGWKMGCRNIGCSNWIWHAESAAETRNQWISPCGRERFFLAVPVWGVGRVTISHLERCTAPAEALWPSARIRLLSLVCCIWWPAEPHHHSACRCPQAGVTTCSIQPKASAWLQPSAVRHEEPRWDHSRDIVSSPDDGDTSTKRPSSTSASTRAASLTPGRTSPVGATTT